MKVKFESDDDLPLGQTFNVLHMIIVVASVLEKNGKCRCFRYWLGRRSQDG